MNAKSAASSMTREKTIDLIAVLVIAVIGLATAALCFGILQSQAQAEIQKYSVGGAIAGALVTISLLASVYLQIRKSSDEYHKLQEANQALLDRVARGDQIEQLQKENRELQDRLARGDQVETLQKQNQDLQNKLVQGDEIKQLRERNEELQQKLIRGAPRPDGYETEIAERQKIVLARPRSWEPRGGVIFDFELPDQALHPGDLFPARFAVSFVPIVPKVTKPRDEFYREFAWGYEAPDRVALYTTEFIQLGGEPYSIPSVKVISQEFVHIVIEKNPVTGLENRRWWTISKQEYDDAVREFNGSHPTSPLAPTTSSSIEPASASAAAGQNPDGVPAASFAPAEQAQTSPASPAGSNGSNTSAKDEQALSVTGAQPAAPGAPQISDFSALVWHMTVACYNQSLETIYYFEFWDDMTDFAEMSNDFNRILASTRFLS